MQVWRVLETRLLDSGKWARLREANREDAVRLLAESGYGGAKPGVKADADALIRAETEATHQVIAELSPEPVWTDLFLLPTDAHNIKALYKGKVLGQDVSRLLVEGGTISTELLRICIENGEYSMLPAAFAEVLEKEPYPDLLHFSAAVDRAVFDAAGNGSKESAGAVCRKALIPNKIFFENDTVCYGKEDVYDQ